MHEMTITVTVAEGLHARPAAELVRLAHAHPGDVTVFAKGREPIDAASVLSVMTLGVFAGDTIVVRAEGEGSPALLDRVAALLNP